MNVRRPTILLSGIHSGPDPSPGVGLARSVRAAFPEATIVGVDYSAGSTGIHSGHFDRIWLQRPWDELNLSDYADVIRARLEGEVDFHISGLDVEIQWLSKAVAPHPGLLQPSAFALRWVRKDSLEAARLLGFRAPAAIRATEDTWLIHRFCRRKGWPVWVKGSFHDALEAGSWPDLLSRLSKLEEDWTVQEVFVQQHLPGRERAIIFAAFQGRLLGCAEVEKRQQTSRGKTWAARVHEVPSDIAASLETLVSETRWTGGGELEFITSEDGQNWLFEINPRFPAYVHGVTLSGPNLPGLLIGAAMGTTIAASPITAPGFARVVVEVPLDPAFPLPENEGDQGERRTLSKHPSMQPQLIRMMGGRAPSPPSPLFERPKAWALTVKSASEVLSTPRRVRVPGAVEERIEQLQGWLGAFHEPRMQLALSVKTLPDRRVAEAACRAGYLAEVISEAEAWWALGCGFQPEQLVLNGPASKAQLVAWLPNGAIVFHDSLESLRTHPADSMAIPGVRLRPSGVTSRFGIPIFDPSMYNEVLRWLKSSVRGRGYGLHVHIGADVVGARHWLETAECFLQLTETISAAVGQAPRILDFGGGWFPDDLAEVFAPTLSSVHRRVRERVPGVETVLFEPGKAISLEGFALATTVTEVRGERGDRPREVIVDASIADLPLAGWQPHRVLHCSPNWEPIGWLGAGSDVIMGSICMEADILASRVGVTSAIQAGDHLLFFDAGAYDTSMAWSFAGGEYRDAETTGSEEDAIGLEPVHSPERLAYLL